MKGRVRYGDKVDIGIAFSEMISANGAILPPM